MKLIRFFLSNILLIAFFCGVIYTYYYWDNLTGKDTPVGQAIAYLSKEYKSVENFIEGIKTKQSGEDVAVSTPEEAPVDASRETSVEASEEASNEASKEASEETPSQTVAAIDAPQGTQIATAAESSSDVFVTPEIEQSLNRAVDQALHDPDSITTIVTDSNTAQDNDRELWINARKAFYKRDYQTSIESYEQLIANTTDNFDAYGELGNVYFNQGKKTEAAASYYEAAAILVKLGQARRADSLMSLLNYLDAEKATQLRELIGSEPS